MNTHTDDTAHVVFLGDFFDSFDMSEEKAVEMANWLAENASNPKYEFLFGNHDLHYAFPAIKELRCSGYNVARKKVIQERLNWDNCWKYFKLHTWANNWLCSHAGIHPSFLVQRGYVRKQLAFLEEDVLFNLVHKNESHPVVGAGWLRGGLMDVGGWTWLDWREFMPIGGINQIVGHTQGNKIRTRYLMNGPDPDTLDSTNFCIDTGLREAALIAPNGDCSFVKDF